MIFFDIGYVRYFQSFTSVQLQMCYLTMFIEINRDTICFLLTFTYFSNTAKLTVIVIY